MVWGPKQAALCIKRMYRCVQYSQNCKNSHICHACSGAASNAEAAAAVAGFLKTAMLEDPKLTWRQLQHDANDTRASGVMLSDDMTAALSYLKGGHVSEARWIWHALNKF